MFTPKTRSLVSKATPERTAARPFTPAALHPRHRQFRTFSPSSPTTPLSVSASASAPPPPLEPDLPSARLASAAASQQRSTQLLAALLSAGDPLAVARQHVEALSEEFFMSAGAYLSLAQQEGNPEVVTRLQAALGAAWAAKQATLAPELQLLNRLVRAGGGAERKQVGRQIYLSLGSDLLPTLSGGGRSFHRTLAAMAADVARQPPHAGRAQLLAALREVAAEVEAIERQAAKRGQGQGQQQGKEEKE
ncbi:hypothetical protein Agub_g7563 [Astrephomene gubernaculifera]|uniref:Uncharacterized protein n=1 Tax=Astrephomene gubernaculifera TaxID=47775 RepID=A0AAD3DUI4_9CHLO|nr:hypothetical protein Agub_g7563 [Astrephomene gubernaculifera]